jgi:hypothetical protein
VEIVIFGGSEEAAAGLPTDTHHPDPVGDSRPSTSGEHRRNIGGGVFTITRYTYYPLDRTASKT